jgi:hypothetical protein
MSRNSKSPPRIVDTVFIAVCHERRSDPLAKAFNDRLKAIEWVRSYMRCTVAFPLRLCEAEVGSRWIMTYEGELDNAFVVESQPG